jgi:hypothetical protein
MVVAPEALALILLEAASSGTSDGEAVLSGAVSR